MTLEELKPGIYPQCIDRHFYKFNFETKKYDRIHTPEQLSHVISFSIG